MGPGPTVWTTLVSMLILLAIRALLVGDHSAPSAHGAHRFSHSFNTSWWLLAGTFTCEGFGPLQPIFYNRRLHPNPQTYIHPKKYIHMLAKCERPNKIQSNCCNHFYTTICRVPIDYRHRILKVFKLHKYNRQKPSGIM